MQNFNLQNTVLANRCPAEPRCLSTKYRTPDGSCNNRQQRVWGKAFVAFTRILPPDYADGIDAPRLASDGNPLPSAREVSIALAPNANRQSRRYTLALMQFGQFLDHDLTLSASTRSKFLLFFASTFKCFCKLGLFINLLI